MKSDTEVFIRLYCLKHYIKPSEQLTIQTGLKLTWNEIELSRDQLEL